jgi:hypothetical protein
MISAALHAVGAHSSVPVEVLSVTGTAAELAIVLSLHYRPATPVCCPEPGCYVPFLGRARHRVPAEIASALGLGAVPRVSITAQMVYEPGYAHTQLGAAMGGSIVYDPDHFQGR